MESIFSVASLFTAYTSLIAIVSLFQQFYDKSVPAPVRNYITSKIKQWFTKPSPKESVTLVVDHYEKDLGCYNLLYKACELYISDKLRSSATRLSGSYMNLNEPISYRIAQGEEYVETLEKDGINLLWKFICRNCSEFSDEHEYNSKDLSLSGLLNFIDGLWSSCGDERIFIFTTNQKERLDPALLRPGRMDMHIHMSYLTMSGFKILVDNYLGVTGEHVLFNEIEKLLEPANATPVQVAEELIRSEDADVALSNVVEMLKKRLTQSREKKKGDAESKRSSKDD